MSATDLDSSAVESPPEVGAAIDKCDLAWKTAYEAELARTKSRAVASLTAAEAYRSAMPQLGSQERIHEFIACVAHGLLLGVIDESQSSRLLYAARIASSSSHGGQGKKKASKQQAAGKSRDATNGTKKKSGENKGRKSQGPRMRKPTP